MDSCLDEVVFLSPRLYPSEAVALAAAEYQEICAVRVQTEPKGLRLEIRPAEGAPKNAVREFLNYALCAAVEQHLVR